VEEIRLRRKKSGVPDDVLVRQFPNDTRWQFNSQLDVDPYPWRTSCSPYNSGTTQVRMNTSVLTGTSNNLSEDLPEVYEEFTFLNNPKEYQFLEFYYQPFTFYNITNGETDYNGALIIMKEAFINGNTSEIGGKYVDRIWTLRVPETTKIPSSGPEVITVPIVVKAYTCEMKRVKEGDRGSVTLLYDTGTFGVLETIGTVV